MVLYVLIDWLPKRERREAFSVVQSALREGLIAGVAYVCHPFQGWHGEDYTVQSPRENCNATIEERPAVVPRCVVVIARRVRCWLTNAPLTTTGTILGTMLIKWS